MGLTLGSRQVTPFERACNNAPKNRVRNCDNLIRRWKKSENGKDFAEITVVHKFTSKKLRH